MSDVKRPPLRYHGGKWKLAPWIISTFPAHRVYVEPFGGGASVLMRKPQAYAEVYNDQWGVVVNVFRVLRDESKATRLIRALELTPFARQEFIESYHGGDDDDVEMARKTILRSFAGFGPASTNGLHPTGFRANSNRSGTTPAHDWRNYPACVGQFVRRLRGVVIENRSAVDVIRHQDTQETLFYCDPPYVHDTRNMDRGNAAYAEEMTDAQHEALAECLHAVTGMVILSGYRGGLYERIYSGWQSIEREAHADGARKRTEVLWFNDAAWNASPIHGSLFAGVSA